MSHFNPPPGTLYKPTAVESDGEPDSEPDYSCDSSKCMENGSFDDDCSASPESASCNDGYHYTQGDDCFMGMGFAFATCCSKDVATSGNSAAVATGYCSWSQCIEGYDARHQDTNTNTYQCHGSKAACDGVCSMLMPGKWCGDDAGDHSMDRPDCPNPMYVGAARGPRGTILFLFFKY